MNVSTSIKLMYANVLLALCEEKPLQKITIKDIINRANTARQTFYNHFKDKYDLINFIYLYHTSQIIEKHLLSYTWKECMQYIMDFCLCHKNFFISASMLEDNNSFSNFFFEHAMKYYSSFIIANFGSDKLTKELIFAIEFNCHGAKEMFMKWIRNGMVEPTNDVAESIYRCMPGELKQWIRY